MFFPHNNPAVGEGGARQLSRQFRMWLASFTETGRSFVGSLSHPHSISKVGEIARSSKKIQHQKHSKRIDSSLDLLILGDCTTPTMNNHALVRIAAKLLFWKTFIGTCTNLRSRTGFLTLHVRWCEWASLRCLPCQSCTQAVDFHCETLGYKL